MSGRSTRRFGALLRDLRRAAGLTQEELSELAHVGVRTLRDLETGHSARPQKSTVDLLAAALGLEGADRDDFVAAARGRLIPRQPTGPELAELDLAAARDRIQELEERLARDVGEDAGPTH